MGGMVERIRTWFGQASKGQRIGASIGAACGVLVLACVMCSCVAGVLGQGAAANSGTANTAQQHQNQPNATQAPAKPVATATPAKPTATPSPADAAKGAIAAQLKADGNKTDGLRVTWDPRGKVLTVELNAQDNITNDLITFGIREDAFSVMKAAYTKWNGHPATVIFHDNGPTSDKYGNGSTGAWGTAVLNSDTASLFNWGNLQPDQAWNDYDVSYYISGL